MERSLDEDVYSTVDLEDQHQDQGSATPQDIASQNIGGTSKWWVPVAGLSAICCALILLLIVAGIIVLALIPIYLQKEAADDTNSRATSFVVNYGTNLGNTNSLVVADTRVLGTNLINAYRLGKLGVTDARFTQSSTNSTGKKRRSLEKDINQCRVNSGTTGDIFTVAFLYEYLSTCGTASCQQNTLTNINKNIETDHNKINVPITFTNGQTRNVELFFCAFGSFSSDIDTPPIGGPNTGQSIRTTTYGSLTSAASTNATTTENRKCNRLTLATWNIGLEEKQATERTPLIIKAILDSDADIISLQEVWGGPQILRTIYQAVKSKYPNFQVVDDTMRSYISADQLSNQVYSPACPASGIIAFEICFFQNCSTFSDTAQLLCAFNLCTAQAIPLYTNSKCWACIFDRFISRRDPLGLNYCGAVNLPQLVSTSPGISPNSTEAPWNNSIGLMILSNAQYTLEKVKAAVYSEFFILIRGYIIVTTNNGQLIISNTHTATVDTTLPHPPAHTFLNNNFGSWDDENKGQLAELESNVWSLLQNEIGDNKSAVMLGDYNMGIANFAHNVSDLSPESWYYIHGLNDSNGKPRWYDDYTEKQNLCTGCIENLVVAFQHQYIYEHIFTHGPLFSSFDLFTKRIFDAFVQITSNNTNVTTSLSDHYGVTMIITN